MKKRIQEAQILLEQCEKDLKRMEKIHEELKQIEENRLTLETYYSTYYMEDYEAYENKSSAPSVLDQDSIWNVLVGEFEEKKLLLKNVANTL